MSPFGEGTVVDIYEIRLKWLYFLQILNNSNEKMTKEEKEVLIGYSNFGSIVE
jgi:hypothetical protein